MVTLNGIDQKKATAALARAEKDKLVVVVRTIEENGACFDVLNGQFPYEVIFAKVDGKIEACCNHAHINDIPEKDGELCKHIAAAAKSYLFILKNS